MSLLPSAEQICIHCGACCATFRVSFYWAEGSALPPNYTVALTPVYDCMAGTNQSQPKCIALQGEVGREVSCSVYAARSSTCKEVQLGDTQCQKARLAHQLPPIVFHESSNDDLHHDQAS